VISIETYYYISHQFNTQHSGHILSRIYNCTKAGNRRAKRGGSRESEGYNLFIHQTLQLTA